MGVGNSLTGDLNVDDSRVYAEIEKKRQILLKYTYSATIVSIVI